MHAQPSQYFRLSDCRVADEKSSCYWFHHSYCYQGENSHTLTSICRCGHTVGVISVEPVPRTFNLFLFRVNRYPVGGTVRVQTEHILNFSLLLLACLSLSLCTCDMHVHYLFRAQDVITYNVVAYRRKKNRKSYI